MTTTVSTLVRWINTQQQANTARALENRLSAGERSPIAATRDRRGLKYTQTGGKNGSKRRFGNQHRNHTTISCRKSHFY